MKRLICVLATVFLVFVMAGQAYAVSCISPKGGWSRCPDANDTGSIGLSGLEFGEGFFDDMAITGTLARPNVTRDLPLPGLAGWIEDGGNDLDDASTPTLSNADNIPIAVWDDSSETTAMQHTFRLPSNYVSGTTLVFYALISSAQDAHTGKALDWSLWRNRPGTPFGGRWPQAAVSPTLPHLDTSNAVLTLTGDATVAAGLAAGDWLTVDIFNASTDRIGQLELKGVAGTFTSSQ